eukprot:TRINITY_DN20143_c0_g1_i1.p1 TRINITY_DN20143_c0_g1~~TRINITY_DN20143_c0_g1_i1.p1  ORF type:complete len:720 (+),score=213.40 TRINITY_DN20143_c0_g1_i1:529-2688(+)
MTGIRNCSLSCNYLSKIPPLSPHCTYPNLSCLFLSANRIEYFPEDFLTIDTLSVVDISFNHIKKLPDMSRMSNLRVLLAAYNPLVDYPIMFPPYLDELNLSGCQLSTLPTGKLREIRILHLAMNNLKDIPDSLLQSACFDSIDVSFNKLKELPPGIIAIEQRMAKLLPIEIQYHNNSCSWLPKKGELFQPGTLNYVQVGFAEMQGKRKTMEDVSFVKGGIKSKHSPSFDVVALFDGHGGSTVAETIGSIIEKHIIAGLEAKPNDISSGLYSAYLSANRECKKLLEKSPEKSGATGLIVLFTKDEAFISNIGDSRAVMSFSPIIGEPIFLRATEDHVPSSPNEFLRITERGGYVTDSGRINGILSVSRAFGDYFLAPYVAEVPSISTMRLTGGIDGDCDFIIIACDGIWDVVEDGTAVEMVADSLFEKLESPGQAATRLRTFAYILGSTDNITVFVVLTPYGQTKWGRLNAEKRKKIGKSEEEIESKIKQIPLTPTVFLSKAPLFKESRLSMEEAMAQLMGRRKTIEKKRRGEFRTSLDSGPRRPSLDGSRNVVGGVTFFGYVDDYSNDEEDTPLIKRVTTKREASFSNEVRKSIEEIRKSRESIRTNSELAKPEPVVTTATALATESKESHGSSSSARSEASSDADSKHHHHHSHRRHRHSSRRRYHKKEECDKSSGHQETIALTLEKIEKPDEEQSSYYSYSPDNIPLSPTSSVDEDD